MYKNKSKSTNFFHTLITIATQICSNIEIWIMYWIFNIYTDIYEDVLYVTIEEDCYEYE